MMVAWLRLPDGVEVGPGGTLGAAPPGVPVDDWADVATDPVSVGYRLSLLGEFDVEAHGVVVSEEERAIADRFRQGLPPT